MAHQKLVVHLEIKVEREFLMHVIHLVTSLKKKPDPQSSYQHFGGTCCFHLKGRKMTEVAWVPLQCWYYSIKHQKFNYPSVQHENTTYKYKI
jgi:hypothetical protein